MTTAVKRRRQPTNGTSLPGAVRVAIYCRVSTDKRLDMEFNSLDAQRQAVEAYILSQRGEGWIALPERYDDGGYIAKNTERPAFQRLLKDIEARKVDCVAVYKVERLSRSLLDCTRILQLFEHYGITFVSITQQFNTTTSGGRLFLNMLMSFAEYEREIISERTRDKIHATRRRGAWTGGAVPLGYMVRDKKLVVNPPDADRVREVFRLYRDLASLLEVANELGRRGWTTRNGKPYNKVAVRNLLVNPIYTGRVKLKDELFPGIHEPIIDQEAWDAVQAMLKAKNGRGYQRTTWKTMLGGLLRCACGAGMTRTFSTKGARRHSYYTCRRIEKQGATACPGSRVSAGEMEQFVVERIRDIGKDPKLASATLKAARKALEARKPELLAEQRRLDTEKRRLSGERDNLLKAITGGGSGVQVLVSKLNEVETEYQKVATRIEEVRGELAAIENQSIDEDDLRDALAAFDGVWNELFPREQNRIMRMLVESVVYDAGSGEVSITFRPGGVRMMAKDARKEAP